jgi:spore germination protein KC
LEKGTAEEINKEIQGAIAKGYEYGTDIFGFGIAVYRKYPQKWEEIKDNWSQELPRSWLRRRLNAT